jgi:hypothetical protein
MTSSYCTLIGPQGGRRFDVTDVGDAYTEMVSVTGNLSLYECMKGMTINQFMGDQAAGCTMFRVRNTVTNKVKMLEAADEHAISFVRPTEFQFVVEDNDILEAFHVVVPT